MRKFWLLLKHEYLNRVRRRSFLTAALGVPIGVIAVMALTVLVITSGQDERPIGYVDRSGTLDPNVDLPEENPQDRIVIRAFSDEPSAQLALQAGEIQAFAVVPADYVRSHRLTIFYWEDPPEGEARDDFEEFLSANLASDLPSNVRARVLAGPEITIRTADGSRELNARSGWVNVLTPFIASLFFYLTLITSASYLLQALTDEKENRTMEVMVTSVSPGQLIYGKAAGLLSVALTQVAIWTITIVAGLVVGSNVFEFLGGLQVPWSYLAILAAFILPTFILLAGIMTAISGVITEVSQGQQLTGVLNLFFMFPWFLSPLLFEKPDHPLLVILSFVPFTSFLTNAMRWSVGTVPLWQSLVSWVLLTFSAGLSLWISARVFRFGMLRYGKRMNLADVFKAFRSRKPAPSGTPPGEVGA